MKTLVYTDGKPNSFKALHVAAELNRRLKSEMAVITVRSHSSPTEKPPPVGVECPVQDMEAFPPGIQVLIGAAVELSKQGRLKPHDRIQIRYEAGGYAFACESPEGGKIPFFEGYGSFIDVLNQAVTEHHIDLLVLSAPRRGGMGRFVPGDTARLLALDLHTSFLLVRGGSPSGRHLVCTDASPSARRILSLLQEFFPIIADPLDLVWIRKPGTGAAALQRVRESLGRLMDWIKAHGREARLLEEENDAPANAVLDLAGGESTIVMGASLRHDLYRRVRGSFPLEIIKKTESSVLLVKRSQEVDMELTEHPGEGGGEHRHREKEDIPK